MEHSPMRLENGGNPVREYKTGLAPAWDTLLEEGAVPGLSGKKDV